MGAETWLIWHICNGQDFMIGYAQKTWFLYGYRWVILIERTPFFSVCQIIDCD